MADNYFCLDFGESYIKIADIQPSDKQYTINNLSYIPTDPSFFPGNAENVLESTASAISKTISANSITKKNVNIIIPDTYTYSQILQMPKLNEKELISAIKYQADQFIPMPIDETSIDIEIVEENEKEKKLMVLMVAAAKNFVEKIQKTTELAGLVPESVENQLSATSRFVNVMHKELNNDPQTGIVLANISFNSTSLYFFEPKASVICLNHTFNIGYSLFLKELQMNLNIDQKKATEILVNYDTQHQSSYSLDNIIAPVINEFNLEFKKFINAILQKFQINVKTIYFTNEIVVLPFLPALVQKSLTIPGIQLNPINLFKKNNYVETNKLVLPLFISTFGGNLR